MKTLLICVMIGVLMCAAVGTRAAEPSVRKFLPGAKAVKDFAIMPDSLQYGTGDDISKIYDGGYELYTRNGVIDAVRQMYQRKSDYVEVTIHTMKSEKAALDFLKYWQKENKVAKLTKTKLSTGFLVTRPSVTAYYAMGKYFVTVSAFYKVDRAQKDVKTFVGVIERTIAKGK